MLGSFKVNKGFNLGSQAADPSSPSEGDFYTNSVSSKIRVYINGAWRGVVSDTDTQTLTNKSMDGGANTFTNIPNGALASSYVKADGSTPLTGSWAAGAFSITANSVIIGSAANRISGLSTIVNTGTLTLPTSTDTLVGRATTDVLSNKSVVANNSAIVDNADNTKKIAFTVSGTTTGKTLTLVSSQTLDHSLTFPNVTDTLVAKTTTDTLTNKTFGDAAIMTEIATPSNPSAGFVKLYAKGDNTLYIKDSTGTESQLATGGGDSLFGELSVDATAGNVTVASGFTLSYPFVTITGGDTYTINGRFLSAGTVTVNGTLTINGSSLIL